MRLYFTLYLVLFATIIQAQAGKKLRVLFIGNSYTYFNNMPQMVADIATNTGDTLVWDMEAPGGLTLGEHVGTPATLNKIKAGNWNYVVLQEQSLVPAMPDGVADQLYIFGRQLDSIINLYNPCAETIFYMTWGRKNGEPTYCSIYSNPAAYNWTHFCTYQAMDSVIRVRYNITAANNKAVVSPVGPAWRYLRNNYPSIELYNADESHPSAAGSYAAACCFYTALFKKNPSLITYNASISSADAATIRTTVKKVAYDSMLYWHIDQYRTEARFTYTVSAATAIFTSTTANASTINWYFGDGSTATSTNPTHTYSTPGIYTAMQVATNNTTGCTDTAYASLNMNTSSINTANEGEHPFTISPNPVIDIVHINAAAFLSGNYHISLQNSFGQVVHQQQSTSAQQQTIDISSYRSGIYFLSVTNAGNIVYRGKLVKQ